MKKIFYIALLLPLFLISCEKDTYDSVFDQTSDERVEGLTKKYKDLLESHEFGWKADYFPNEDIYGQYRLIFNFDKSKSLVEMLSDYNENSTLSSYKFLQQQEPSIVFDTHGTLHELSDPSNGRISEGYQGEFEFYFRDIRNDSVFLVGKLHGKPLVLTKASEEDYNHIKKGFEISNLLISDPIKSVFRYIKIGGKGFGTFDYNAGGRYVVVGYEGDDNKFYNETRTVRVSAEGITLVEPVEINGVTISGFRYNENSGLFEDEGISAVIDYSVEPEISLPYYEFGTMTYSLHNTGESYKSSQAWNKFYTEYSNNLSQNGVELNNFYFVGLNSNLSYIYIRTSVGDFYYVFTYQVTDEGKVYFKLTGNTNASQDISNALQPLLNVVVGSANGYYIKGGTGNYLNYSNQTFSLINADTPSIEINYWDYEP